MSSLLYRLGRACYRRRGLVLGLWAVVLGLAVVCGLTLAKGTNDTFNVPGTESQRALDVLNRVFPEVSGTSAQLVISVPDGQRVDTESIKRAVADSVAAQEQIPQVSSVVSPFDESVRGAVSEDGTTAIIVDLMSVQQADLDPQTLTDLRDDAASLQAAIGDGAQVHVGGDAFSNRVPQASATEAIGLGVAFVILLLFFRSFGAAVVPVCTAILGVAITEMTIQFGTRFLTIMATAPMLAMMIGLAVGIDYALFILSRHRDQMRDGLDPEESAARAIATAGSAVVFAGVTVVIALLGLFVAEMPFLTLMGVAAALGVTVAVAVALTVIPAVLGLFGERMRPKQRRRPRSPFADPSGEDAQRPEHAQQPERADHPEHAQPKPARRGVFAWWVDTVTRVPIVTILIVLAIVGALAWPAASLKLALPDNGSEPVGNDSRDTYDLVSEKFGPGYNGPLIVEVNLLSSHTPVEDMDGLRQDLLKIPGVASVPLSTPNPKGDTGIVQVIPEEGPASEATAELVQRLRDAGPRLTEKYHFRDYAVTGITAVQVDVSEQLGGALLPFGVLVVGLSLVLLVMVFRSIAVPIKATVGYVLSVLAAFGATSAVFVHGWGADFLHVAQVGSVVSFLPIILMGVLFGLAMDYEVFLVSRTAEEYSHSHDAEASIRDGFIKAAPVVTVAALIMLGVFVSFIPEDNATIKPIAFALAVGVFVDAFLVRMTLVPAVLALLGRWAWWMPTAWHRRVPRFDVEGEGLTRQLRLADWPAPDSDELVSASGVVLHDVDNSLVAGPLELHARPGELHVLVGPEGVGKTALLYALAGHVPTIEGDAKVDGLVLPDRAATVRERCALVIVKADEDPAAPLQDAIRRRNPVVLIDDLDAVVGDHRVAGVRAALRTLLDSGAAIVATAGSVQQLSHIIPAGVRPNVHQLPAPDRQRTAKEILA